MSVAIPSLRGAIAVPTWSKNELWRKAVATPSLDQRFAESKSLIDSVSGQNLITFTRASAGTYVNSAGLIETAAENVPRFTHNPVTGESLGLLVEEQRTNLQTYSEQFDDAAWYKTRSSIISNAAASPDGTTTADKLVEDSTASNTHQITRPYSVTSGTSYTWSVYLKAAERSDVTLSFANQFPADSFANFNLSTGTVTPGTPLASSITELSNGWYRCSISATASSTATSTLVVYMSNGTSISYTGDGTSGIYLWGAQLEAGAFPTSYIPTTDSAVTRSADVVSISGSNFSSWFNGTEGSIFTSWNTRANSVLRYLVDIEQAASSNDRYDININTSNIVNPRTVVGGSAIASLALGSYAAGTDSKVSFGYRSASYGASLDNANIVTSSSEGGLPTDSARMFIGSLNGSSIVNGTIRRLSYFPQRLSNNVLQSITL